MGVLRRGRKDPGQKGPSGVLGDARHLAQDRDAGHAPGRYGAGGAVQRRQHLRRGDWGA